MNIKQFLCGKTHESFDQHVCVITVIAVAIGAAWVTTALMFLESIG